MDNNRPAHTYMIVDPNTPDEVLLVIRQILIDKLKSMPEDVSGDED